MVVKNRNDYLILAAAENVELVGNCCVYGIVGKVVCNLWETFFVFHGLCISLSIMEWQLSINPHLSSIESYIQAVLWLIIQFIYAFLQVEDLVMKVTGA